MYPRRASPCVSAAKHYSRCISAPKLDLFHRILLLTLLHFVLHRRVARVRDLRHEVHVDKLAFLWRPFAVCITIEDHLLRSSVSDLCGGVGEGAFRRPFDVVAVVLYDWEGRSAALVAVSVDAFVHGEVEDGAAGDN